MLKTVSSITNAIGALNFKGTWDANANSPALASSVGTKGDYYVVGTAGATNLNGISNWGVGDLATFNGSVWQRVEGGADLNGVNLSVSGTTTLSGLTASTALALNASKEAVSVTNTGTGNNVLADGPTLTTPTLGVASATSINKVALTAPATGSTLTIADGKTLTANNSLTLSGTDATTMTFPNVSAMVDYLTRAGNVLQVISANSDTAVTTTGAVVLTVAITPSSTANKILIIGNANLTVTANLNAFGQVSLSKNGNAFIVGGNAVGTFSGFSTAVTHNSSHCLQYLDSPNTTSSINYELYVSRGSGNTTSVSTFGVYSLTVMEIAG
jgi:hypothetical protein